METWAIWLMTCMPVYLITISVISSRILQVMFVIHDQLDCP